MAVPPADRLSAGASPSDGSGGEPLLCGKCGAAVALPDDLFATSAECGYCRTRTPLPSELAERRRRHGLARGALDLARQKQANEAEARRGRGRFAVKLVVLIFVVPAVIVVGGIAAVVYYAAQQQREQQEKLEALARRHQQQLTASVASGLPLASAFPIPSGLPMRRSFSVSQTAAVTRTCAGGSTLSLRGEQIAHGTLLRARGGCRLTLTDCTAEQLVGIDAADDAVVVVRGGKLRGAGTIVRASGSAQVTVDEGAELVGEMTLMVSDQASVRLRQAKVVGETVAVMARDSASFDRGRAEIVGTVLLPRR